MQKVGAEIVQDLRYFNSKQEAAVKLRVTFRVDGRWIQKYYGNKMFCTAAEFKTLSGPRSDKMREIKSQITTLYNKAITIINDEELLTIPIFESRLFGIALDTVNGTFQVMIDRLKKEGRLGTLATYQTTLNNIKAFTGQEILRFSEITDKWLRQYEANRLEANKSINTIGIEFRTLRAVFNEAIRNKTIPANQYPFKTFKIKTERKYKVPLSDKEITLIKNYKPKNKDWAEALDYFKLSYYCNGMNVADIIQLKNKDILEDFILYDRSKTRRTKIQFKKIFIPLDHEISAIITRRRAPTLSPEDYVFPILENGLPPTTIKNRKQKFTKRVNEALKDIAIELKIKKKLTSVIARHTYSNRMLNGGADLRMIQEGLGHSNLQTTEHYAGTIYMDKVKKAREAL